jgi:F0F1-type ATP synthase assembly protein I
MIFTRDAGMRRLAGEILLVQAATTIAIAGVCALIWGRIVALSALAGGTTGLIANAVMMLMVLGAKPGAAGALGRLMFGQLLKVMITVSLLFIVVRTGKASWPALLVAYAATLFVYWLVPVLRHRMRRAKD